MRKITLAVFVAVLAMFGALNNVYSTTVGSPSIDREVGKFNFALEQEYIFGRDMKSDDVNAVVPYLVGDPVKGNLNTYGTVNYKVKDLGRTMLNVGYKFSDMLNVYGKVGITDGASMVDATNSGTWAKMNHPSVPENFGTYKTITKRDEDNVVAGAIGFKLSFPFVNDSMLNFDTQYLTHKSNYNRSIDESIYDNTGKLVSVYSNYSSIQNVGKVTVAEWHVAPYVSRTLGDFTYYVGMKYSDMKVKLEDENLTLSAKHNVGAFIGTEFKVCESWSLNLEGRFLDETAVSVGLSYLWGKPAPIVEAAPAPVVEKVVAPAPVVSEPKIDLEASKVKFELDKYSVRSEDVSGLQHIAKLIKETKPAHVRIEGYTDNTGSDEYNVQLSQKRAEAAKVYLVSEGIDASIIETSGYGASLPVADNSSKDGRFENRRVEFVFTYPNGEIVRPKINE